MNEGGLSQPQAQSSGMVKQDFCMKFCVWSFGKLIECVRTLKRRQINPIKNRYDVYMYFLSTLPKRKEREYSLPISNIFISAFFQLPPSIRFSLQKLGRDSQAPPGSLLDSSLVASIRASCHRIFVGTVKTDPRLVIPSRREQCEWN